MEIGRNTRRLNYIMMFSLFVIQALDNYCREKRIWLSGLNMAKNGLLLFMTLVFLYEIFLLNRRTNKVPFSRKFLDETRSIINMALVFALLSIYFMQKNHGFEMATIIGLARIVVPVIVVYALVNVMEIEDIYNLMSILLIIMFAGYICAVANRITLKNILAINFIKSYSPFESTMFSPAAMGFCLFFCYYRQHKILTILSVIFTILTFKRIMVLYAVFLLFFGGIVKKWRMPVWTTKIFIIGFTILSIFYIQLMNGEINDLIYKYFGITVNAFSMGRSYFMRTILNNFKSFGFMSSTVGYRSMEMDIPMIYVEMGILAVIAIIYFMSKLIRDNWYNFLIVFFCLLELLTSHWLDIVYFWIVAYLTIGCISYNNRQKIIKHIPKVHFIWR